MSSNVWRCVARLPRLRSAPPDGVSMSSIVDSSVSAIPEALQGYPVRLPISVAWGEMDAFQHVNNVMYFRFFESARIEYGRQIALMDLKEMNGAGPILAATSARYKRP